MTNNSILPENFTPSLEINSFLMGVTLQLLKLSVEALKDRDIYSSELYAKFAELTKTAQEKCYTDFIVARYGVPFELKEGY